MVLSVRLPTPAEGVERRGGVSPSFASCSSLDNRRLGGIPRQPVNLRQRQSGHVYGDSLQHRGLPDIGGALFPRRRRVHGLRVRRGAEPGIRCRVIAGLLSAWVVYPYPGVPDAGHGVQPAPHWPHSVVASDRCLGV